MDKATSLYRYFDASGELLYIGITSRRTGRSLQHAGEKDWWGEVARAEWEHFASREEALAKEQEAIKNEHPLHNVIGNLRRYRVELPDADYLQEALARWPNGMDAAWDKPMGNGGWAVVAWCGPLTVTLWRSYDDAVKAYFQIDEAGCGHACQTRIGGDHELVDLGHPAPPFQVERERLVWRLEHLESCQVCMTVYSGQAPAAARARHLTRVGVAA